MNGLQGMRFGSSHLKICYARDRCAQLLLSSHVHSSKF